MIYFMELRNLLTFRHGKMEFTNWVRRSSTFIVMQIDNIYNLHITLFQNSANTWISYWGAMGKHHLLLIFMWVSDTAHDKWMNVAPQPKHGVFTLNLCGLPADRSAYFPLLAWRHLSSE